MAIKKICIPALLVIAVFLFSQGLANNFLLDDFANLETLERLSSPLTFESLTSVVFTNPSGVFGRIISLASFALQYQSWPNNASAFKLINIFIHLLNGLLIFWLTYLLSHKISVARGKVIPICIISSTIWMLHPQQVSTVLYVIQRMTELSSLFTLLGLIGYIKGREIAITTRLYKGYFYVSISLIMGTILAFFSKENGVLLPIYALVIEFTILNRSTKPKYWKIFLSIGYTLPLIIGSWYFLPLLKMLLSSGYVNRDFTLTERLLTESHVLWDYLRKLAIPGFSGYGVFHDDYPISKNLLDPSSTLLTTTSLIFLFCSAICVRKRFQLFSFSVLWFLTGHLVESTILPLELYFEHRNYLAIFGPIFTGVILVERLIINKNLSKVKPWILLLCGCWMLIMIFSTWLECSLWGNPTLQGVTWAKEHPNSIRAQKNLATVYINNGNLLEASNVYRKLATQTPNDPSAYISWLWLGCYTKQLPMPNWEDAKAALSKVKYSTNLTGGLSQLVEQRENGTCIHSDQNINSLFEAVISNPNSLPSRFNQFILYGRILAAEKNTDLAIFNFKQALSLQSDVEVALLQVKTLAEAGRYDEALSKLPIALQANKLNTGMKQQGYAIDIENWKSTIQKLKKY